MQSKILENDKDEWIYNSMQRYKNLYMFELEFPVDSIDVINQTSIAVTGIQPLSKKCELVQLAIPPTLLPKDIEEGLSKDRDFTIISGGYAASRILQLKSMDAGLVATRQIGVNGITLFQLGDEEHAIISEVSTLSLPDECLGAADIDTKGNRIIIVTNTKSDSIHGWIHDSSDAMRTELKHKIPKDLGTLKQLKFWDTSVISLLSEDGTVALLDTRDGVIATELRASGPQISGALYSHDTIHSKHKIGIADSFGGYDSIDVRRGPSIGRTLLPGISNSNLLLSGKFNLQFEPNFTGQGENFVVTGMVEDHVHVYQDSPQGIRPVFVHDGHLKAVSHSIWHDISENLIFSCSIDSVLHAWQFNEDSVSP